MGNIIKGGENMNKNVVIAVVVLLVVVVLGVGGYMLLNKKAPAKSFDIEAAAKTLSESTPFNEMATMDVTTEELATIMGVNADNVEKVYGKIPMMNVHASMYLLIQAKEGTVDTVKNELDKYVAQYEEQWSMYLPAQYEYVKNRKEGVVGNTIYLIIAENSEALENAIVK